jgi:hypothetical protein
MARRKGRPIKCSGGDQRFTVVRVNGDNSDTHAGRSFEQAMSLAQPDRGARVDVFRVCAGDAGEARLSAAHPRLRALVRNFRYKGR